ncbi:MAG TPA: succinate dehydrogenase/fumarate reductase iron-sulfur subunit [Nitrospiria bacterium]
MRIVLEVEKFNPEADTHPYFKDYRININRGMTVLDALIRLKQETDGTLTFRCSCRSAICGSCSMVINGQEKLACKTQINEEWERYNALKVGPMKNMPVLKDLAVDMQPFWEKVRDITPWLENPSTSSTAYPEKELAILPKEMNQFHNVDSCILCGACVSACTSLEVSEGFLGPAALAKAYRFMADPREEKKEERLDHLMNDNGIWDCVRCNFCVEVCPKDVQPMEAIIRMRRMALSKGKSNHLGAKHITVFSNIVRHEGKLNETLMPLKMLFNKPVQLIKVVPLAFKMLFKGKSPSPFKKPIRGILKIKEIFKMREERQ